MFVKWTENRLKMIPKIKNKLRIGMVCLIPGINFVPEKDWVLIKDVIKRDIKNNRIIVFAKESGEGKNKTLKPMKIEEIEDKEKVIAETNDLKTLKEMKKQTSKDEVRSTIKDQEDSVKEEMEKLGQNTKGK